MHGSTKKWLVMKLASGTLIPFMIWFLINFVNIFDSNYSQLIDFFSNSTTKVLFSLFLILAFTFFSLTISEIFEDYIGKDKLKNVANKFVYFFSIVIPLFVIICLIRI
jgi:succinate dehydrogenase / fumarate reductase membrane anchor subunit|tara:strand:- start:176 stop:499 length:324 start_codon:yes stop_codon:yes gene_type:complete